MQEQLSLLGVVSLCILRHCSNQLTLSTRQVSITHTRHLSVYKQHRKFYKRF